MRSWCRGALRERGAQRRGGGRSAGAGRPARDRSLALTNTSSTDSGTPILSPELAREEAAHAALTMEIKPGLRLPDQGSVMVMDTFEDTPELVPVPQEGTDLNKETSHAVQKKACIR